MMDMTDQYNTQLTPEEEAAYQQQFSPGDSYDYDMRGWFKKNQATAGQHTGHFPDTYKKPNHPTFSDQSIYHGGENQGGTWIEQGGKTQFIPGKTNMDTYGPLMLQDYFNKTEPDVQLVLPEGR